MACDCAEATLPRHRRRTRLAGVGGAWRGHGQACRVRFARRQSTCRGRSGCIDNGSILSPVDAASAPEPHPEGRQRPRFPGGRRRRLRRRARPRSRPCSKACPPSRTWPSSSSCTCRRRTRAMPRRSCSTSTRMPVAQVTGGSKIERDHVYVIPPTPRPVDGRRLRWRWSDAARPSAAGTSSSTCSSARWREVHRERAHRHRPFGHRHRRRGRPRRASRSTAASSMAQDSGRRRVRRACRAAPSPPAWSTSSCRWPRCPSA